MSDTKKKAQKDRGQTRVSQIRTAPRPNLHGIAEQLYTLQQDLEVARRIQEKLLPPAPEIKGWDFGLHYQPAQEVGGDFYDVLPMGENRHGILVADASGKGLAGALLMVQARGMLRTVASMAASPRQILAAVNRVLLQDLEKGKFVTIFLAVLDSVKNTMTMANAGHTPMLVWRKASNEVVRYAPRGIMVGMMADARFVTALDEGTVELRPGDRFLLYSDGVSELMNPVSDEFGMERLEAYMLVNSDQPSEAFVRGLNDVLEAHQAGHPQSDDITIFTGRLLP